MPVFAIFFILFGGIILAFPDFLAYIIGFLFLFIGVNSLAISLMMKKKNPSEQKSWSFGKYEILKKK